ncbi:MAG: TolC family protein [Prevotellaceae bacterium]|jgi:cobalt-zinc-cadmium resistance protein CzcA|nr:TolC family protein [Prevotellaceae bacterium]
MNNTYKKIKNNILCLVSIIFCLNLQAQENRKTLNECIEIALKSNLQIQYADLDIKQAKALQGMAFNPDKTEVSYSQDALTPDWFDRKITVSQSFEFPSVYAAQGKLLKNERNLAEKSKNIAENDVKMSVAKAYCNLNFAENNVLILQKQDSVYQNFITKANVRYSSGESNILELMNAKNKAEENRLQLNQAKIYLANCQIVMQKLLNSSEKILTTEILPLKLPELNILSIDTQNIAQNPLVSYYEQQIAVKKSQIIVEKNRLLPNIFGGYSFNDIKVPAFEVGLSIPLFFGASAAKIKAAKAATEKIEVERQQALQTLQTDFLVQYSEYVSAKESLNYYENTGLANAKTLQKTAQTAYNQGEIGYLEFIQNLQTSITVQMQYLTALNAYNQAVVLLNYYLCE